VVLAALKPRARVLVLDDALFARATLGAQLRARHLEVEEAASVLAAEMIIAKRVPQIAIVDVVLENGPSGIDFVRRLRADPATQRMLIIVISGSYVPEWLRSAEEAGCDRFLLKPYSVDALFDTIEEFLGHPRSAASVR
jgi:CheY-like chemotaxis protein